LESFLHGHKLKCHWSTLSSHVLHLCKPPLPLNYTASFDGQPYDATVVVPDVCSKSGAKQGTKEWVHYCRQPYKNETVMVGKELKVGNSRVQTFDRTGWILQQLLKLGCSPDLVPGIGPAYLVIDADTIFYEDYSPIPLDDKPSAEAYNYMPGDPRDCANPPYFMTLDALRIPNWDTNTYTCAGRGTNRKCKHNHFCPIAHGNTNKNEFDTYILACLEGHDLCWILSLLCRVLSTCGVFLIFTKYLLRARKSN
jgi:hypothetical protein